MDTRTHWESIYSRMSDDQVSWFEADPALSVSLILETGAGPTTRVLDVGGGSSRLVDRLLDLGIEQVAVLDVSAVALARARERLGAPAGSVRWIEGDVTSIERIGTYDIWHDRAVFHFLTEPSDRSHYAELAARTVPPGGHLIMATFAMDGPERCSGLPVQRYDEDALNAELGSGFALEKSVPSRHLTPAGVEQAFNSFVYRSVSRPAHSARAGS